MATDPSITIVVDVSELRAGMNKVRSGIEKLRSAALERIIERSVLPDPCPFCGSIDAKPDEIEIGEWAVCCYRCGATGPQSETSPQHAISKWNMVKQ